MTVKKELLAELKKYNKELEKHVPNVDFTTLVKAMPNSTSEDINDESFSILATSLVDLRTEMALMRKNLSNEIEAIVLDSIRNQQNSFLEQTNKVYTTIITDLKQSFSSYIKEMNSEVSDLKKELANISSQNNLFDKRLTYFNESINEFRKAMGEFDIKISDNKEVFSPLNTKLELLEDNFKSIKK